MRTDGNAEFAPTQWSMVLLARRGSAQRQQSLARLFKTYWQPLYGYLRRHGHSPADAEDLAQSFFLDLIEGEFLERPDPSKGRFRGYLLGALRRYLGTHYERQSAKKRGGGTQFVSWANVDAEQEYLALMNPQLDPSEAYEKSWAITLLAQCLQRLEAEQVSCEKTRRFAVLKPFLGAMPTSTDYDEATHALGSTRSTVAVWLHRLNQRYAEIVKMEVAATIADPSEMKQEMGSGHWLNDNDGIIGHAGRWHEDLRW